MPSFKELPSSTQWLAVATVLIGAGALAYGGYAIQQTIVNPFKLRIPAQDLAALVPKTEEQQLAELRQADSDNDTLSDYDESYIHNTNPYNEDSDSDGVWDSAEIKAGSDPNCAPGEDCRGIRLVTADTKISDIFPQFSDSTLTLKDKTLSDFKKILLAEGYEEEKLAEISDAELLILLEESLKVQEEAAGGSASEEEPLDYDEVRQLLIELGVSQDEVYSLSNEEVMEILNSLQ